MSAHASRAQTRGKPQAILTPRGSCARVATFLSRARTTTTSSWSLTSWCPLESGWMLRRCDPERLNVVVGARFYPQIGSEKFSFILTWSKFKALRFAARGSGIDHFILTWSVFPTTTEQYSQHKHCRFSDALLCAGCELLGLVRRMNWRGHIATPWVGLHQVTGRGD